MKNQIREDYKNWLLDLTCSWCSEYGDYSLLMDYLYSQPFYSIYPNDENRASDGIEMRFRFIDSLPGLKYTYHDAYLYLTDTCNMLEMMVALARRCEDHIMGDPDIGDRSGYWFWQMIDNMHLSRMNNENFDYRRVEGIINNVLDHNYDKNGNGGLFSVRNKTIDMRRAEIWYQMNWHLGELYDQY